MSIRSRIAALVAVLAVGAFSFHQVARAGEDAPPAKAAPEATKADAPKTGETTKTETPATKTPAPIWSVMMWVGKQVAPNLDCACPAKPEGEKAWRTWFAGGKDIPLASLRDQFVADGWTADRFVTFFQEMAKKQCDCKGGDCAKGDCAKSGDCAKGDCKKEGCCEGKGERADGKPCCGKCKKDGGETAKTEPKAEPKPEAPAAKP
jgi:hypothetical protein